jgi:hypothetical protein
MAAKLKRRPPFTTAAQRRMRTTFSMFWLYGASVDTVLLLPADAAVPGC